MCLLCGHQTLTSEHKLCGWSIKLVRYSNNHDNSDVWVVYKHRNNNVYHRQDILENHIKMNLASQDKVDFLRIYARTAPQQFFAAHCKSSSNFEGWGGGGGAVIEETELNMYKIRKRCLLK